MQLPNFLVTLKIIYLFGFVGNPETMHASNILEREQGNEQILQTGLCLF